MKRHCAWLIACSLGAIAANGAIADEVRIATKAAVTDSDSTSDSDSAATVSDLGGLLQQLDAPEFAERQEASRKLSEAGKAIFPQIEKAAEAGSREAVTRAVEILRRHFQGGDLETKEAAQAALARLAKGGNAAAAGRAADALNPPAAATIPQPAIAGINPAIMRQLQQRGIQIQLGGFAPGQNVVPGQRVAIRTRVRSVNGLREIEVETNGKITKVKDAAAGGIEASITEIHPNGKETTRKIEAKDLDDLKKKDADAAQIYETYSRRGGGIQIGALPPGALPPGFMPGGAFPGGILPVPAGPAAQPPESIKRLLESIDQSIERYKAQLPNDPNAQRRLDSLEQMKKRYQEMLPKEETQPARGAAPDEARRAVAEPKDPFAIPPAADPFQR